MSNIDYTKFKDSLKRLEERYKDYQVSLTRNELLDSDRESIKESCIQRFEVCFDTTWKHLRKYLMEDIGLIDLAAGPNPIFKNACASKVIDSAEVWIQFNIKRGNTSHDYSGEKANDTFEIIPSFIAEAINLYETISKEKWQ
ncbi:MAG: nucleotidyltransferase [Proteobacteria bacterium]|jgi:nucleotidyltransferase substrate binding protein (TIGR01987 family)|nr:nucleotidyltransferase [Pseudomonadota bacterium]